MKIGIDCRMFSSSFTGIGRYCFELVRHLEQTPHEYVLFLNDPQFKDFKAPKNCKKVRVNAPHYSLKEQTTFLHALNKEKLDLMHFPHFNVPLFYRHPYIVTIHDLTLTYFPGKKLNRWYHRFAYHLIIKNATRRAKKIIAVSENTKKDIINELKINPQKIITIHNGIGNEFHPIPHPNSPTKNPFLLYTGVWRNHKNIPALIEALAILRNDHKLDLDLIITGRPDPAYPEIKESVARHKLESHTHFPGLVPEKELINLYNAALFYVFPSLYEGFGFPPLEAMKCGTPAVVSNRSCIPEICGDAAVYFNPEDPQDIAKKIATLYKDPDAQAELIEKGIVQAQKFTWPQAVKETYKLYEL